MYGFYNKLVLVHHVILNHYEFVSRNCLFQLLLLHIFEVEISTNRNAAKNEFPN